MAQFLRPAVQLLAGIPSVVYGFFGLVVLVPLVREVFGGTGSSLLTASVLLGMMILPTIITVAEAALNAMPSAYYEGALALGATHERSVFHVVLPAAKSGVMAGIILGVGRAIGEATVVMMVAGNRTSMPKGLLKGVRTLTSNIVIEMGYATDLHREALIATAVVLIVGYILWKGVPHLSTELFVWEYNSTNVSMMPSIINTLLMTVLSLLVCVPLGIGVAIWLTEYASRGSRLVKLVRMTAETLSGILSLCGISIR